MTEESSPCFQGHPHGSRAEATQCDLELHQKWVEEHQQGYPDRAEGKQ